MALSCTVTRLVFGALVLIVAAGAVGALNVLDPVSAIASASLGSLAVPMRGEVGGSGVAVETPVAIDSTAAVQTPFEVDVADVAAPSEALDVGARGDGLVAPAIAAWLPDVRRCHHRGRSFCDGPRQVPAPQGEGAERATRLGLGSLSTYRRILSGPADAALLAEAGTPDEDLLWPVPEGVRGRGFGYIRREQLRGRLHRGVDIPAAEGSLIRATNEGLVIYADNEVRGYGNLVAILHGDDTRTLYAHLERAYVFAGQTVARGEVVGVVGRTGLTRAPHLHFEWRRRAVPRNPSRRFVDRPDQETERRLYAEQLQRREEGRARLAEQREARERRQARRAERETLDNPQTDPILPGETDEETHAIP